MAGTVWAVVRGARSTGHTAMRDGGRQLWRSNQCRAAMAGTTRCSTVVRWSSTYTRGEKEEKLEGIGFFYLVAVMNNSPNPNKLELSSIF